MTLKLFEFLEQFMIDTFLITLTQFEKTGSIDKILNVGGKSDNSTRFSKLEVDITFHYFYMFAVRSWSLPSF